MDEDEPDDDAELEVPIEVHTVCPLCGGAGILADPKLAIVRGVPRTIDNGRPCVICDSDGHFPGTVPPL